MSLRVALVGAEVRTALGGGLSETVKGLLKGETAVAPIRGFDAEALGASAAAQLPPEPAAHAPDGPTRVVTPHGRTLELVARAAHDAARAVDLPRESVGFYVALGMVDSEPDALAAAICASREAGGPFDLPRFFRDGFRSIHPHWPLQMLNNVAVGQVAADLDVRGDNLVLSSEADAGARAIGEALEAVRRGDARAALAAGVSEQVSGAALLRAALRGQPGLVLGEGGGALVLEGDESAKARGITPVGFVRGAGFAFGPDPDGPGPSPLTIERAARAALEDAGLLPSDVGLLLVEGTGASEAEARRALFGARRAEIAVVAPAVGLGDLRAGAPAVAVALAAAILAIGQAPSMAHGRPRPLAPGTKALVLASGTAGGAAALVVEGPRA